METTTITYAVNTWHGSLDCISDSFDSIEMAREEYSKRLAELKETCIHVGQLEWTPSDEEVEAKGLTIELEWQELDDDGMIVNNGVLEQSDYYFQHNF